MQLRRVSLSDVKAAILRLEEQGEMPTLANVQKNLQSESTFDIQVHLEAIEAQIFSIKRMQREQLEAEFDLLNKQLFEEREKLRTLSARIAEIDA